MDNFKERLEAKRNSRPQTPTTREEFDKWLEWHADPENAYAWDFDFRFEINGHTISASGLFRHIVVDRVVHDVMDDFCTVIVNGVKYKPTDYIKLKVWGDRT